MNVFEWPSKTPITPAKRALKILLSPLWALLYGAVLIIAFFILTPLFLFILSLVNTICWIRHGLWYEEKQKADRETQKRLGLP